jgi:hypothetical protein
VADGQRPESALDRALRALEVGLQSSYEGGVSVGDLTRCARCRREPRARESEFCPSCREHLLREELDGPVELSTEFVVSGALDFEITEAAVVQLVRLVPPELLALAERLEEVVLMAQALGLPEERCAAVVDEEIERCRRNSETTQGLLDRVRRRFLHEGGRCVCASGVRLCGWNGLAPVRPTWRWEDPCG